MGKRRHIFTAFLTGFLLLVVGSQATQTTRLPTWASLGPNASLRIHSTVGRFALSPDGTTLASVASDRIVLRDVDSGNVRYAFPDAGDAVTRIAFNPAGNIVAGVTQG